MSQKANGKAWGFWFLLLYQLVIVGRVQDSIQILSVMQIGVIAGGLALVSWLIAPGTLGEKVPLRIPSVRYGIALLGLGVILIPISVWPTNSLQFIYQYYIKAILLLLLIIYWCKSLEDFRWILWAYCLGGCVIVLTGLNSGVVIEGRFYFSRMYDPNDLALFLVIGIPFLLYLSRNATWFGYLLAAGTGGLYITAIVMTKSRGGFLALMAVGIVILSRSTMKLTSKIVLGLLAIIVFGGVVSEDYWERIRTIWDPQTDYDRTAGDRTYTWERGLEIFLKNPWGIGIEGFSIAGEYGDKGPGTFHTAHNIFIQVGVELGVVGLMLFIFLLARTIQDIRYPGSGEVFINRTDGCLKDFSDDTVIKQILYLSRMLEASFVGFLVGAMFLSMAYSAILYLLVGLAVCVRGLAEREGNERKIWSGKTSFPSLIKNRL